MPVAAHHHEIGGAVGGVRQQRVGNVDITSGNAVDVDFESMPGEMLAEIGALDLVFLAAFAGNADDFDTAAFAKDRDRVGNSARGGAAAIPANYYVVGFERRLLDIGH